MTATATAPAVDQQTGEIHSTAPAAAPQSETPSDLQRLLMQDYSPRVALEGDNMDKMTRLADVMAKGVTTVPKHLQGNLGDCMAVVMQAMNWNMNPFAVAQKTHLVNGTLGYEAQLVIAVLNSSPLLATRLDFEWFGQWIGVKKDDTSADRGVRVHATLRGESTPRVIEITMAQVGSVRNSPNWANDPRQQIAYLAAKRWGRLHAPDVILGVYTPDELQDGADMGIGRPPANASATQIAAAAAAKVERTDKHAKLIQDLEMLAYNEGFEAFKAKWASLPKEDRAAIGLGERDRIGAVGQETDAKAKEHAERKAQEPAAGQEPQS